MKILVVDIDGTYIRYAGMKDTLAIEQRGKIFTPQEDREELIEAIARLFEAAEGAEGIAVSMPGIIDSKRGYCAMGGALRYNDDFFFRHYLHERCPVKIHIENNAKCAAMAEATVGSLQDVADGFFLVFSTMVGGGYILEHKLYKGKHFAAGEVSYLIMDRNGKPSYDNLWGRTCGVPQFLDRYAKAKGMESDAREALDVLTVFDAVGRGESEAVETLSWYTKEIAVRIFNIQTVLDPERFSIGGEVAEYSAFMEYLRNNLKELYAACPFHIPMAEIVTSKFRHDANLIGAFQCYLADPS